MKQENPNEGQCDHIDCMSGECLKNTGNACIYMEDQEDCPDYNNTNWDLKPKATKREGARK